MANIAVDIDDTLTSFTDTARQVLLERGIAEGNKQLINAAYSPWDEWRAPPDLITLEKWLEIIDICHEDEMIWKQEPFPGALETLWDLIESGHNLIYISNRNPDTYGATMGWLERCGFPVAGGLDSRQQSLKGRAKLVTTLGDKHDYIQTCQYMIDDRPKTLVEFVYDFRWHWINPSVKRKAFSLHRPYNQSLSDVPGIYLAPGWSMLRHYLEKKNVITNAKETAIRG